MTEFIQSLTSIELMLLIAGSIAALGFLTAYSVRMMSSLKQYLAGKTESTFLKSLLDVVEGAAKGVVETLNQGLVEELKAKSADGKLTKEEIDEIKEKALKMLIGSLSAEAKVALGKVFGDLNAFLGALLERKVVESKNEKAAIEKKDQSGFLPLDKE